MKHLEIINKNIQSAIDLKVKLLEDDAIKESIVKITEAIIKTYKNKGKVLFCGNGGSSADAQHLAAELSGRYYFDRPPLNSEALHVNSSYLTAVANDYSFDEIYARYVLAVGLTGDVLIGLSTSGNSKNVLRGLEQAQSLGMFTVGLTGQLGDKMKEHCDVVIKIPSMDTPRVQECHMLIGHTICELVEAELFGMEGRGK